MVNEKKNKKIEIKMAENETLYDLYLCAKDHLDVIDDFKIKFLKKEYFILTAYNNNILVGILIAEDKSKKIDCLRKIVPNLCIHLLYVNKNYRNEGLGKRLINTLIMILINKGFASIYVKLPEKNKKGINFFLNNEFLENHFQQVGKMNNKVLLELHLWNDYGVSNCQMIQLDSFALY